MNPLNLFGGKSGRYVCIQRRDQSDCGGARWRRWQHITAARSTSPNSGNSPERFAGVPPLLGLKNGAEKRGFEATERAIHDALGDPLENRTVVLVAHRLSTLLLSDEINGLTDRTIVQNGTHREPIDRNGEYRRQLKRQYFGLETDPLHPLREDPS